MSRFVSQMEPFIRDNNTSKGCRVSRFMSQMKPFITDNNTSEEFPEKTILTNNITSDS